jgi:two-component system NtrC family response regulator
MANILIIDDEQSIQDVIGRTLKKRGHQVKGALNMHQGLKLAQEEDFELVILDLNFPEGNGLEILPSLLECNSYPEVIILTGVGDQDGAKIAYDFGAWDFLQKPFSIAEVSLSIARALQYREEKIASQVPTVLDRAGIVGCSQAIQKCLANVAQAAASKANVLITGETGTGKELFARAIHFNSQRSQNPFVVVDCTVLPETLVESTLFGHEKGAFTGADKAQSGLVTQAHDSTLFLDEVGELPISMQKAFLRVLQERCYRPVGAKKEVKSNFRLIAATNRNLDQMVSTGDFRKDLLYRLQAVSILLPPLRQRKEDIPELVHFYLGKLGDEFGFGIKGFSPEFLQALKDYSWPGNVRELINTLERALAAAGPDPTLHPKHLPARIRIKGIKDVSEESQPAPIMPVSGIGSGMELPTFKDYRARVLDQAEAVFLNELMNRSQGDRERASEISGLSTARLYALLKKHNMPRFSKA